MSLFDSVKEFFNSQPIQLNLSRPNSLKAAFELQQVGVTGRAAPLTASRENLDMWSKRNELVFACVEKIKQAAIDPTPITERINKDGKFETVKGHPLTKLLARPNPLEDGAVFWGAWLASEHIFGEAYAEIERNNLGQPNRLWLLDPRNIRPIAGRGTNGSPISAYEYTLNGRRIILKTEDVLVRRNKDLTNNFYGLSPLAVALGAVDMDTAQTDFVRAFFTNGGVPSGLLRFPDSVLTPETAEAARQRFMAKYGKGGRGAGGVAVLDRNAEYQKVGANLNELESDSLRCQSEARICCLPDTMIQTQRGLVPITEIVVGDMVLTHKGRWRAVKKTLSNPVHDEVFEIKANGFDALRVTGNHPIYAANYTQNRSPEQRYLSCDWIAARDVKIKKERGAFNALTMPVLDLLDNPAKSIRPVDWIKGRRYSVKATRGQTVHSYPDTRSLPETVPLSAALGRLLGFYLAEGSQGAGKLLFYFHTNETAYHNQVLSDLKEVFGADGSIKETENENVRMIVCQNAMLTELFACGTARTKQIPAWAWAGGKEFFDGLLWGWAAGDGTINDNAVRVTTVSRDLAWGMRIVAVSMGLEASVQKAKMSESFIDGREIKGCGYSYIVSWRDKTERRGTYRIQENQFCSPVRSSETIQYDGLVYNIEVEEDESYLTTGGMVHNCSVFGVPPILVGAYVGILHLNQRASVKEAQTDFWINKMSPLFKALRTFLTWNLLPEFENIALIEAEKVRVSWDMSRVMALQEDTDKRHDRARKDFQSGLITLNEGRAEIGQKPDESGSDYYLRPSMAVAVTPEVALIEAEKVPVDQKPKPLQLTDGKKSVEIILGNLRKSLMEQKQSGAFSLTPDMQVYGLLEKYVSETEAGEMVADIIREVGLLDVELV